MAFFEDQEIKAEFLPRQALAIPMLARGIPKGEVARQLGVAATTLSNWHQSPAFTLAIEHARRHLVSEFNAQFRALADEAVAAVRLVLTDPKASHRTKLRAVELVLTRLDGFENATADRPLPRLAVQVVADETDQARLAATCADPKAVVA